MAVALAEVAVGPLAQRWLTRRVMREARRHHLFLSPVTRPKAIQLARQLVEGPAGDRGSFSAPVPAVAAPAAAAAGAAAVGRPAGQPAGQAPAPGGPAGSAGGPGTAGHVSAVPSGGHPAAAAAAELTALLAATATRPGLTTNLARWQARISRCLLEALGGQEWPRHGEGEGDGRPGVLSLEGVLRFRLKEFGRAIERAAAAAVAELLAERDEQRMFAPWRSLWLGPPPRLYEVHVLRDDQGTYRLLDRWGDPAGSRTGEPASVAPTEDVLVSQLMRLGPRRIVVHLEPEDPGQVAVRGAFPGRVHTCRGCPRCARARQGTPRRPG